ncbi:MAG: Fur family transcriptional regulator [Acidimicrobiia bacterium]
MATVDQRVEERLTGHGVRYTRGRRSVVAALARADGPRSAAELVAGLRPRVPVSSLYRSLGVLEEAGVVAPHHGARGVTRYELAEWIAGHHHHLVCIDCGMVEDVTVPKGEEVALRRLVESLALASGFAPLDHVLEIEGRCPRCR